MLKKISLIVLSIFFLSACSLLPNNTDKNINLDKETSPTMTQPTTSEPSPSKKPLTEGETLIKIKTKNGDIVAKLYQEQTPNTVANFLSKSNSGFYNGLTFHRVIEGFMAQGGDPTGTGMGGGKQTSELNNIPFKRGSFGLARTAETKTVSNDSQFFICFTTEGCQHLTSDYVNFGEVVSGLEFLDKIVQGDKILEISPITK
jgi:cyclophilin family peptidyl-prolyl cis-trans isomerase